MAFKDRLYPIPIIGTAVRVSDRYALDRANQLAAALGFFGFLSLFPLILVAVAVAGAIVGRSPELMLTVEDAVVGALPGLGDLIDVRAIAANAGSIGLVGAVGLLWSGLKVIDSAQEGTSKVFRVTTTGSFIKRKARSLVALVSLGTLALVSTAVASAAASIPLPLPEPLLLLSGLVVAAALDTLLFLGAYRFLSVREGPTIRQLLPGAMLAATAWAGLKVGGGTLAAASAQNDSSGAADVFGPVLGVLFLFYLAGRIYFYGAELAAVQAGVPSAPAPVVAPGESPDDVAADGEGVAAAAITRDDALGPLHVGSSGSAGERNQEAAERMTTSTGGDEADQPVSPLPPGPQPSDPSPAVGPETAQRLASNDARNQVERDPNYVRKGIAFAIAAGVVGTMVKVLKPGAHD